MAGAAAAKGPASGQFKLKHYLVLSRVFQDTGRTAMAPPPDMPGTSQPKKKAKKVWTAGVGVEARCVCVCCCGLMEHMLPCALYIGAWLVGSTPAFHLEICFQRKCTPSSRFIATAGCMPSPPDVPLLCVPTVYSCDLSCLSHMYMLAMLRAVVLQYMVMLLHSRVGHAVSSHVMVGIA